jgi:sugar phosphate isomerase/epimerase
MSQPHPSQVVLSGFADEAAHHQTAVQQFAAFAALGLQYYSIRFIDAGNGPKNVMKLSRSEITAVRHLEDEYGLNVASIGSPIGKVKLLDVEDGTKNPYVPFKKYLEKDVKRACDLAHAFETKLIRGFSFYHPRGTKPEDHIPQVVDQLGQIAEMCLRSDLTLGIEIEANLVGCTGPILAEIHRQVNEPAMMLVFDGGNISCQGYRPSEVFEQYLAMKPAIAWMHIKDYRHPGAVGQKAYTDEAKLKHFVPVEMGDSAHDLILKDFAASLPNLEKKLRRRGNPGVFLELEPHLKAGGQFGGASGPDGMGVALRSLCRTLDYVGIGYHLRDFADICAARGY